MQLTDDFSRNTYWVLTAQTMVAYSSVKTDNCHCSNTCHSKRHSLVTSLRTYAVNKKTRYPRLPADTIVLCFPTEARHPDHLSPTLAIFWTPDGNLRSSVCTISKRPPTPAFTSESCRAAMVMRRECDGRVNERYRGFRTCNEREGDGII